MKNNKFIEALKNLVDFEWNMSVIYPWVDAPDEIIKKETKIKEECNGSTDTDSLYKAITKVCGVSVLFG